MPEEIYYAPLASAPTVKLEVLLAQCAARGLPARAQIHSPEMCWVCFDGLDSQFVVSTTADAAREIGLVTIEFSRNDGEDVLVELSRLLELLGLSNDPDAQYR